MVTVISELSPVPLLYLLNPSSTFSEAEYLRFLTNTFLLAFTAGWSEIAW